MGDILERLHNDGLKISRVTYYVLEKEGLFQSGRTIGRWRRYTKDEANIIINLIKENYGHIDKE